MKLKTYLLHIFIAPIVLIATATGNTQLADTFALKGVCKLDQKWMLSVQDNKNGYHLWMYVGQSRGSLKLLSYDSVSGSAQLSYQDQTFSLKLGKPSETLTRIDKKTEAYRQGTQRLLEKPDSGARSQEAQQKLERDLEVSVANYRHRLLTKYIENTTDPIALASNGEAGSELRITGGRRRNQVNSRIWASDHIEKHGLPE